MASVFPCSFCGLSFKSVKFYVDHQALHRHEANAQFPCCVADCKGVFFKYSAFKTHYYRLHKKPPVSELDTMQGPFTCESTSCRRQCTDLKDLLAHLRSHLSKSELIKCPFAKCGKIFKVRSSFTSHISRIHKHATAGHVTATCSAELGSTEPASDQMETDPVENIPESVNMPDEINMREMYTKNLCMFYMKLQAKYLIPSSTLQMIVEETNDLFDICSQHTKNQFKDALKARTNLSDSDIDEVLNSLTDLHSSCSTPLSTEYTRKQFFQRNFDYVHPQAIHLGTDENRFDRYVQYIPLKETLKVMLKDPVVWQECIKTQTAPPPGVLTDVCDGSVFKSNAFCMQPGINLKLILYQDAFEIVNPLGSAKKKHKIVAVYFTLANFEPFYRSSVDQLQLLLLCTERDFKYFGHQRVFSKMFSDLRELEDNGFVSSSGHTVRATLLCIVGDNLGSHCIGGYAENFSTSSHCCRYCMITRQDMDKVVFDFPVRTVESYKEAVQLVQDSETTVNGVKFDSLFNGLQYFHVCQPGLPPCIGHDIFEGVVAYDLSIYIKYFVKVKKWMTYEQLNRQIKQFKYQGSDASSVPSEVNERGIKVGGQAAENWCFLRLLPIIIGDRIRETQDQVWQLVIMLKEVVELVCAPKISTSQVSFLQVHIQEYLETRRHLFPSEKLKPKHHYLLHYPSLILKLGPLIRLWTMRFESKHSYFKRCVRRTQNFKNVCQSLANNHQLLQSYMNSCSFFPPPLEVKDSSPYHAELYSGKIRNAVEGSLVTPDLISTRVRYQGTLYKKGIFLCLKNDESVEFGQLELILMENKKVYFVMTPHSSSYLLEYGLHKVGEPAREMLCISADRCLDFYPLVAYSLLEMKVISLKHSVLDC